MMFDTLADLIRHFVPTYKSKSWKPFVASWRWDSRDAHFTRQISEKRSEKRIASYVIPGELKRSRGAIRFGVKKEGHGYHKERGDFCLVGAALAKGHLTLFYRRVELLGGLHYDLAIIEKIHREIGPVKKVTIMAAEACVFALKGNSNEKLYAKLMQRYSSSK